MNNDNRNQGSTPSHGNDPAKKAPPANQGSSGQSAQQANRGTTGQPHGQKMQDPPKKR